jgi:hypothetical protein
LRNDEGKEQDGHFYRYQQGQDDRKQTLETGLPTKHNKDVQFKETDEGSHQKRKDDAIDKGRQNTEQSQKIVLKNLDVQDQEIHA